MFRVGTFNVENLDSKSDDKSPPINDRAPVLRTVLNRMNVDILCLQEVHAQKLPNHTKNKPKRCFAALKSVLEGTKYEKFQRTNALTQKNVPYAERNLVILIDPKYQFEVKQYKNTEIEKLQYRKVTAKPVSQTAQDITWERPILHVQIIKNKRVVLDIINLHLKSRLATDVSGQKKNEYTWDSAAGWAEGYFLSSIKRVGQALETRVILDKIFDCNTDAKVLVCGDFNAEPGEVPVEAICGRVGKHQQSRFKETCFDPL